MYALSKSGSFFFKKFLKVIFHLSPFENLHHSLLYLSLSLLPFFSSTMLQRIYVSERYNLWLPVTNGEDIAQCGSYECGGWMSLLGQKKTEAVGADQIL